MSEIYNINPHYTDKTKVERPLRAVAQGPKTIPNMHLYNDNDAKVRLSVLQKDVYKDSKKEKNRDLNNFIVCFGTFVIAILGVIGVKKIFK